jgi:hypothetical protein
MNKIEELTAAARATHKTQCDAENAYHYRMDELQRQAHAQIEAEDVGKAYRAAQVAHNKALNVLRTAEGEYRVRNALDRIARLKLVERMALVEWKPLLYPHQSGYALTGRKGVLQVVGPGDEFSYAFRWRRPSVGDTIVRLLKKDGSMGINHEIYTADWLPEGVRHPKADQETKP